MRSGRFSRRVRARSFAVAGFLRHIRTSASGAIPRRYRAAASMQARRLSLQARQEIARALHRQALVIEAQAVQPAQLLAGAGAAGAAVIALRHHDAVAGMGARDRGIDGENAPVARPDLADHADEKILVLAVDRGDERAAAARDQRRRLRLVAIRD